MPRKHGTMSSEARQHLSVTNKAKWTKAKKYAKYLGLPVTEVLHNIPYLEKNLTYSQIQNLTHYNAQKILVEGDWKGEYKAEDLVKANNEQQSDYVKSNIRAEKYERNKAEACGYKPRESKIEINYQDKPLTNPNDPSQDLKVAFWFINKMGGIEKASKIFAAAKLAIEAMSS